MNTYTLYALIALPFVALTTGMIAASIKADNQNKAYSKSIGCTYIGRIRDAKNVIIVECNGKLDLHRRAIEK